MPPELSREEWIQKYSPAPPITPSPVDGEAL
jgi:hypothetical protein